MGTIAVVAAHNGHIDLIEHSAYEVFLNAGSVAQYIPYSLNFRGTPLNHQDIRIYEAGRGADVHSGNKRSKINNYIVIFDLECRKKRFCSVRGKDLTCVGRPPTRRQKYHTCGRIAPHGV